MTSNYAIPHMMLRVAYLLLFNLIAGIASAHTTAPPFSLKGVPVPEVPGLLDGPDPIVVNKEKALVLGKALFWDQNVGSDGVACASCHFHAGADSRSRNQLAPAGKSESASMMSFEVAPDGTQRGINYELKLSDFPFFQLEDPLNADSAVLYESDDVVSSAGTFGGNFERVGWSEDIADECNHDPDPVFHDTSRNTRKVADRNAPTVINAIFNFRNFWDGRANHIFNGSSGLGERDPDAGVWVINDRHEPEKVRLKLVNSSLASQAVAPPLNATEMSCENRRLSDLGRKLLWRKPLENQEVHWNDSVLGQYSNSTEGSLKTGLNTYYRYLIMQAFSPKYWSAPKRYEQYAGKVARDTETSLHYEQIEANFGMFFGLALQIYQSTLISDDSPFDRSKVDHEGVPVGLSELEKKGFKEFSDGHCAICHFGPHFTTAAVHSNAELVKNNPEIFASLTQEASISHTVVNKLVALGAERPGLALVDVGFASTGVSADGDDIGLGGKDDFNNPLSFSEQYVQLLVGNSDFVKDEVVTQIRACDFENVLAKDVDESNLKYFTKQDGELISQPQSMEDCFKDDGAVLPSPELAQAELDKENNRKLKTASRNSYKIPNLRNIELTGPYMHNGSMATLEQVLEFYARGGNYPTPSKQILSLLPKRSFASSNIIDFLKTLTDDRVRFERAPFDHPALRVSHGHSSMTSSMNDKLAEDKWLEVPAVGAEGREEPLKPFDALLEN